MNPIDNSSVWSGYTAAGATNLHNISNDDNVRREEGILKPVVSFQVVNYCD